MSNQTIDGVPRELLSEWLKALNSRTSVPVAIRKMRNELRALLDAPAIKPRPFGYWLTPKKCAGLAMFQRELIEDPVLTASVVEYFHVTPLYDTPAAQSHGEPVAIKEAYEEGFSDGSRAGDDQCNWQGFRDELAKCWPASEAYKLYAEHPAPVIKS